MTRFSGTALGQIEAQFNRQFDNVYTFHFSSAKRNVFKRYLKGLADDTADTGITVSGKTTDLDGRRIDTKPEKVTIGVLQKKFADSSGFGGDYATFQALVKAIVDGIEDNAEGRAEAITHSKRVASEAAEIVKDVVKVSPSTFVPIPLFTSVSAVVASISDADTAFTLKHLHKDSENQLYWRMDDGEEVPLPLTERDGRLSIGADVGFWDGFFKDNAVRLRDWLTDIYVYLDKYGRDALDEDDMAYVDEPAFEAGLRAIVPTFILNSISIGKKMKSDPETGARYCDGFDIRIRSGNGGTTVAEKTRAVWQDILKTTLVRAVPAEAMPRIEVFSNNTTAAIHRLPRIPRRSEVPKSHPDLKDYGCRFWHQFLRGRGMDGNTKFPSQHMGELRFAKAIYGVFSATDRSRQILCAFGDGQDGKSVCFEALAMALGPKVAKTGLSQRAFDENFGLWTCINSRLLVVDDLPAPYEFMENDTVKRISGAGSGTIEVDRKNLKPYTWTLSGCKIVMATNNNLTLRSEAVITRCLPLTFTRNYLPKDSCDSTMLTEALANEVLGTDGDGLLTWAIDVLLYYTHVTNAKGERCPLISGNGERYGGMLYPFDSQSVMVATDEAFNLWMTGEYDLRPNDVITERMQRQQAFADETTVRGRATPFVTISQEVGTDTTENTACMETAVRLLIEPDELGCEFLASSDLADMILRVLTQADYAPSEARMYLKSCGLDAAKGMWALTHSASWRQLLQSVMDVFGVSAENRRVGDKRCRGFSGLKLRVEADIIVGTRRGVM